jgi:tetratricopeptide (TPR) repeat protein
MDTLDSSGLLAMVLSDQGKYEEAEKMHRKVLTLTEKVLGKEHPDTLTSMKNLALVLSRQRKYEEAEVMHRQALTLREKLVGKSILIPQ